MNDKQVTKQLYQQLVESARYMRKNPTQAEKLLWDKFRKKQLNGFRFRRQHVVKQFIVDFYCPEAKLIVEVDGRIHEKQRNYDGERDKVLNELGYFVIRFTNTEIREDLDKVLASIYDQCLQRANRHER